MRHSSSAAQELRLLRKRMSSHFILAPSYMLQKRMVDKISASYSHLFAEQLNTRTICCLVLGIREFRITLLVTTESTVWGEARLTVTHTSYLNVSRTVVLLDICKLMFI